jgi:hypothetical protein
MESYTIKYFHFAYPFSDIINDRKDKKKPYSDEEYEELIIRYAEKKMSLKRDEFYDIKAIQDFNLDMFKITVGILIGGEP